MFNQVFLQVTHIVLVRFVCNHVPMELLGAAGHGKWNKTKTLDGSEISLQLNSV